jgi:adiponectin receptor
VHNETGNIWTHALGGVWWTAASLQSLRSPNLAVRADAFTFRLHAACYALCGLMPLGSALAHTFYCRSAESYVLWWDLDHVGILALWLARALCEGFVLLYCHRALWQAWALTCLLVFPLAARSVIATQSTALFLPLFAFIHVPLLLAATLDDALLAGGAGGADLRSGVALTVAGSLCGVAGYALMVLKLPERLAPGKFDLWGHSHQWWHVLTMAGPLLCLEAGRILLAVRLDHPCAA